MDQIALYDKLCENNEVFWHWKNSAPDTRAKANDADIYISGANAISENGEILNIDGMGNRLAGQIWGHKKVYIISGTNKICPDFESALYRARNTAAVENCKRFAGIILLSFASSLVYFESCRSMWRIFSAVESSGRGGCIIRL